MTEARTHWGRCVRLTIITGGVLAAMLICSNARAERINHAGRILGPAPVVTTPTLFNTAQGDAIVSAMQIFPVDNPWNEVITNRPVHPNSAALMAMISSDLGATRQELRIFLEMNYVLVPDDPDNLNGVPITFVDYPAESDLGPYPIPSNMPIETWPTGTGSLTLEEWQRDTDGTGGDRHSIVVRPTEGFIWETWQAKLIGANWTASNGAKFDLKSNDLRQDGWTSGDAAGLPMFPALIRYDECQRGEIEHALRVIVKRTRREYFYPATHFAASTDDPNVPAMGQRLRLKASVSIPAGWSNESKCVAEALKKYGGLVADNGGFLSISACPDDRWPSGCFDDLRDLGPGDFEIITTTGPSEGPRSPGAPTANAGVDMTASLQTGATLSGAVTGTGVTVSWHFYEGPGTVTFANASAALTTASFSAVGSYTLMLSASDGIHTTAYDAVVVNVVDTPVDQPTTMQFDSPAAGATLTGSATFSVTAHDPDEGASNGDGVLHVDFALSRDAVVLSTYQDTVAPFTWDVDTSNYADGSYVVSATAASTAAAGGTTASGSLAVSFDNLGSGDLDTDTDGLPDWWEDLNGLDAGLIDSDGNGIDDPDEDPDGDEVSNLDEYINGTDPNRSNAPSIGDGSDGVSCAPASPRREMDAAFVLGIAAALAASARRKAFAVR